MNEENWVEAKHEIMKKYYMELYKEEPQETRRKEHKNGNVAKGRVLRRIDICIEIFEKSLWKQKRNRRRHIVLELKELTKKEKFFMEGLIIKFVMRNILPIYWVRGIDLDNNLEDINEEKKELNSVALAICDGDSHHEKAVPESSSSAGAN